MSINLRHIHWTASVNNDSVDWMGLNLNYQLRDEIIVIT